jgi:hypothetical protein
MISTHFFSENISPLRGEQLLLRGGIQAMDWIAFSIAKVWSLSTVLVGI